ncbi:FAD/NAD(P)-binding protein [Paracoccus aminophilus]|uniref:FAD-dependent urate hydroxylase HpyO/Asp monooxygenase CreE-like FAD/NAD(P)-binding domain-containing protein n=1 Tax=Paracoccus aminophilus JCM 7686 TaxID=1367847 RepID=S5XM76_PARAH|nr:FAD/NAD(P)-binding protein [Paracoccus aminophilus]AGT08404.1 hypothetical protein JCM7686_1303 [Paracoccus aminophilus JCM 7686]
MTYALPINAAPRGPHILIIGGGFAGAALAIRLLEKAPHLQLTIAEPRAEIGRGVAYDSHDSVHLVNGPAGHFSLYPDSAPDHLAEWVRAHGRDGDWTPPEGDLSEVFIPRRIFGTYVAQEFARAALTARPDTEVTHLRSEIVALRRRGAAFEAETDSGARFLVDRVVLATGVFPFAAPAAPIDDPRYIRNPWQSGVLDPVVGAKDVLLIGASLSMIDMVASLEARGLRGRYHAISRRGHLIEPRRVPEPWPPFLDPEALPRTATALLRAVNRERKALRAAGGDWQALAPAVREHILPLWLNAPRAERLRFIRHLRALWDVTLHRAAPPSFAALERARTEGRFSSRAARLLDLSSGARLTAHLRPRGGTTPEVLEVDAVIDCRGHQEHDWRRVEAPLVRQLLASGLVRAHDTGFGIDATPEGQVIAQDGRVQPDLLAIGHPLRGVAWESSSIPEQRIQAAALAERILAANGLAAEIEPELETVEPRAAVLAEPALVSAARVGSCAGSPA